MPSAIRRCAPRTFWIYNLSLSHGTCRCITHQHNHPRTPMSGIICESQMHCELRVVPIKVSWATNVCIAGYVQPSAGRHNILTANTRGWCMCENISERMPSAISRCAPQEASTHVFLWLGDIDVLQHAVFDSFCCLQMYPARMQHNHPLNFMSGIICESQTPSALGLNDMYFWNVMYICMSW